MQNFITELEFEGSVFKHVHLSGTYEEIKDKLDSEIPELNEGENLVLNAWSCGRTKDCGEHYVRRLGIYRVVNKQKGEKIKYKLKTEEKFKESALVDCLLSGETEEITNKIKGLKYLSITKDGKLICFNS